MKPPNILIHQESKQIKLGDFGISRVVQQTALMTQRTMGATEDDESALGYSMGFASPEQVGQMSVGVASDDIYSVGAVHKQCG